MLEKVAHGVEHVCVHSLIRQGFFPSLLFSLLLCQCGMEGKRGWEEAQTVLSLKMRSCTLAFVRLVGTCTLVGAFPSSSCGGVPKGC